MPKAPEGKGIPPITIPFFSTGLFTYRNPLYAPFRSLGVNVISYHDALIGGQDMEVTDLLEVQRRPGYSRFCSVQLGQTEIVNQFYSFRKLSGQVLPFFDSNVRWALFSPTSITTLLNKTAGAGQGFCYTVGNTTYFADGQQNDFVKLDQFGNVTPWGIAAPTVTPTVSGTGFWQKNQTVVLNQAIVDTNGNVQVSSGGAPSSISIYNGGLGNSVGNGQVTSELNGRGQGLLIDITTVSGTTVTGANIHSGAAGIGYLVGNLVVIGSLSSNSWSVFQVTGITGGSSTGTTGNIEPQWQSTLSSVTRDGSVIWVNYGPISTWYAGATYAFPSAVLDSNGNLQIMANQTAVPQWNSSTAYTVGNVVQFGGNYYVCEVGATSQVPGSVGISTSNQTPYWLLTANPLASGLSAPQWSTTFGGLTTDGSYTWQNCGPGFGLAYNGYSYCHCIRTIYGDVSTASPTTISTGPILGPQPADVTSFAISGNVVTFQAVNNLQAGNVVQLAGLSVGTYLNNIPLTVISSGLTTAQFEANFTHANVTSTNDSGIATPQIAQVVGPGLTNSLTTAVVSITQVQVSGNVVTLTAANSFVSGLFVTISGLTGASFLNGLQFQVLYATATYFQIQFVNANYGPTADSGTATFNAIEVYRTGDGGGIYYAVGALTNPGAGQNWTLNDFVPDSGLYTQVIAPLAHVNDPPPGAPGSIATVSGTIIEWWQGRLWMAAGNYVYFDAGPDCLNGNPHSCWPPNYAFQFAGPVTGLKGTDKGMMVWLGDRYDLILGGPSTASFYQWPGSMKIGLSSPNAIEQDGQTIWVLTTQGQFWKFEGAQRTNEATYVGDVVSTTFPPAKSYVTCHRQGLDDGVYIFDGSSNQLRLGINLPCWSPLAKPVGGLGAARSIETSVGVYSLMAARPTAAGYLLARNTANWQDDGQNFSLCQATIGSIQLSTAGAPLMEVRHIVAYLNAVGTLGGPGLAPGAPSVPNVAILSNEIAATPSTNFIPIGPPVSEPPTGAQASSSLQQWRWPLDTTQNPNMSLLMHHLQIQITFAPENAPNTIKQLAIKSDQQ